MDETLDNASLWSDGRRTFVLPFSGSDRKMRAYMAKMGINTRLEYFIPVSPLYVWKQKISGAHKL